MVNGFFVGDIIGNSYTHENESFNKKVKDFELFTDRSKFSDDTILSFATIDWLLHSNHTSQEMFETISRFYRMYPDRNPTIYGKSFCQWIEEGGKSGYRRSEGNGGAMRCSPIAWYAKSEQEMDKLIDNSISVTHNSNLGKLGAKIVCKTIWLLRQGESKESLKTILSNVFGLDLTQDINEYRNSYSYTSNSVETVRPALISFLNSTDYEDAIRNAVSFGGDTDTITTICSAISESYYKEIPQFIIQKAKSYLPQHFLNILDEFDKYLEDNATIPEL